MSWKPPTLISEQDVAVANTGHRVVVRLWHERSCVDGGGSQPFRTDVDNARTGRPISRLQWECECKGWKAYCRIVDGFAANADIWYFPADNVAPARIGISQPSARLIEMRREAGCGLRSQLG